MQINFYETWNQRKGYLSIINGKFGEFQQERPNITDNVIDFQVNILLLA